MLRKLFSIWLWCTGGIFFAFSCFIFIFSLTFLSKNTTFQIVRFLFAILIKIMGIKLVVKGLENIDFNKTYLIMGNHQSLFDAFVIPAAIPICFTCVGAAHYFKMPVWGYLFRKWGCIPIQRDNLNSAISSLEHARKVLMSGMSIVILPEGSRTLTGKMASFKKGPFHLAKGAKSDILPFFISGVFDYNQKSSMILRPGKVIMNIGKSISYNEFKNLSIEELRQHIFDIINNLSYATDHNKYL